MLPSLVPGGDTALAALDIAELSAAWRIGLFTSQMPGFLGTARKSKCLASTCARLYDFCWLVDFCTAVTFDLRVRVAIPNYFIS